MPLVTSLADLDLRVEDLPTLPRPDRVLLADPAEFDVVTALNPHMRDAAGELKRVDRNRARAQWEALKRAFEELGLKVDLVPPLAGAPDLVFCANQALPIPAAATEDGVPRIVPSRMASAERAAEVPHVERALVALGYRSEPLVGEAARLEGTGDGLWHPRRRLLWGGVGPRTNETAWVELAERYDLPVVTVRLTDERFYHLDTCLALLDERTCLWVPDALAPESRELVEALVPRRIECEPEDAELRLAANACCPDDRHVLIQTGCDVTAERLEEAGFVVVEVETGEFLKSGGSVFCMKLLHGLAAPTA